MPSRGCRVPPEGRGWGPAKSPYGGGSAGGPAVAWCSGSVVIVTGGTNTAASAAGGKRGGANGGPPTGGTSKAGRGSILCMIKDIIIHIVGRTPKGTFRPYQTPEPQKFSGPLGNPPSHHEKVAV